MSAIVANPSATSASSYATWYPTNSPYPRLPDLPCSAGAFYCPSAREWAQCTSDNGNDVNGGTRYVFMGNTAAGTTCFLPPDLSSLVGHIGSDNAGYCAEEGAIVCGQDGDEWYRCDHGGLISMGQVAAGTACQDGAIVVPYDGPNGPADGGNAPYTPPAPSAGPSSSYIYGYAGYNAAPSGGAAAAAQTGGSGSPAEAAASNTDPPVQPTAAASSGAPAKERMRRERKRYVGEGVLV